MTRIFQRTLDCGLPVIVERVPSVRSASFSWLLPGGAAYDPPEHQGISAMWSELLLRGAGGLNSRQHADAADRLGASRTANSGTFTMVLGSACLATRVLDVLPLFVDMVLAPRMDFDAIEPTRDLCMQALESLKDDPTERAMLAARKRHHPSPINRSGLGTEDGLRSIRRDHLLDRWRFLARPRSSIFAAAGAIDPEALCDRLSLLLGRWSGVAIEPKAGRRPARGYGHEHDDSAQVQIVVVHDAPPEPAKDSLLEKIAVSVLSGGMSGRLFSEVREKRGLCYSVSAGYRGDRDYGTVTAYVGTTPERADQSLEVLLQELRRIGTPEGRVTREEFERAIIGMKSSLIFGGESMSARAAGLAADQRKLGRPRSLEEIAKEIDAVTLDDLNQYLSRRSLGRLTVQTLGPKELKAPSDLG